MSFKRYRIIFILIFMLLNGNFGDQTTKQQMTNDMRNAQPDNKEGRALFPRIEYSNEWQPVGRGDPLKDPTYSYQPPVLDRVRYWAEGTSHKNKNDILLLGVPSKKLSSVNQKADKFTYGPIKRTYYSPPFQSHFSSPLHHQQQQQYLPQRLMPPLKHVTDSYPMSTQHYQHHQQQQHGWKTPGNVYTEPRPENSINHMRLSRPLSTSTSTTRLPSTGSFLPTIPPIYRTQEPSSTSAMPMTTQTTKKDNGPTINGHMMPSRIENTLKDTTKPLLQSILQTETAVPFTKKPSSVYQIEYTSNIYNPQAINSMATSSSHVTTFTPTKPTIRPMSMKTTIKTSLMPSSSTSATTPAELEEIKHYVQPDMHAGWPVYNDLIIEGHSKVKTYGLKNDDAIGHNLPKIRPVQPKENPIVERVTNSDEGPEFNVKHLEVNKEDHNKFFTKKTDNDKNSAMTSLLSLLDSSFGNFLSNESVDKVRHESENKIEKNRKEKSEKHKTRRSIPDEKKDNNKQERVFSVSFQVDGSEENEPRQTYRKGTVISENLWPFQTADSSR